MAIELPKKYHSLKELATRFQCSEQDVSHLVIEGQITPSFYLDGGYHLDFQVNKDVDFDGIQYFLSPLDFPGIKSDEPQSRTWLSGFHYLVWMQRKGVAECEFSYAAKSSDCFDEGDIVYGIERSLCLKDVLRDGVVMADELARFEALYNKNADSVQAERPLANRERDTLLTIIAALCKDAGYDHTKHAKTAGLIQSTAAKMGIAIGETTIEGHLKKIPDALATRMK